MDISTWVETRNGNTWTSPPPIGAQGVDFPFGWRHYGMYAFLTDGDNSRVSGLPHIANPYRGFPKDSEWLNEPSKDLWFDDLTRGSTIRENSNNHGFSWVGLDELLAFDYDQQWQSPRGPETVREELGESFFEHLNALKTYGEPENVRVVFYFN